MGLVRDVAIVVLAISLVTFVAFFGRLPAFRYVFYAVLPSDKADFRRRNTPVGFLHRVLWIHTPRLCSGLDRVLTGGRLSASASRIGNYLFYEKHYVVTVSSQHHCRNR